MQVYNVETCSPGYQETYWRCNNKTVLMYAVYNWPTIRMFMLKIASKVLYTSTSICNLPSLENPLVSFSYLRSFSIMEDHVNFIWFLIKNNGLFSCIDYCSFQVLKLEHSRTDPAVFIHSKFSDFWEVEIKENSVYKAWFYCHINTQSHR